MDGIFESSKELEMAQQESTQELELSWVNPSLEMTKNDEEKSQQIGDSGQPSYHRGILYLIHPVCGNPYWVTPVRLAMPQSVKQEKANATQETHLENPQSKNQQIPEKNQDPRVGEGNSAVQNGHEENKGSSSAIPWLVDPSNRWILPLACAALLSRYVLSYLRVPMRFGFTQHWAFSLCVCFMALLLYFLYSSYASRKTKGIAI